MFASSNLLKQSYEMNILERARQIVYDRSEEKERMYGPFEQSIELAAKFASLLSKKEITPEDMYHCMIGMKLSRQANSHKEDNLLDCVAYMASLNDYQNKKQNEGTTDKKSKATRKGNVKKRRY